MPATIMEYDELSVLYENEFGKGMIVHSSQDGKMYVKKIINSGQSEVYERIQSLAYPSLPAIVAVHQQDDTLVVIQEYVQGTPFPKACARTGAGNLRHMLMGLCEVIEYMELSMLGYRNLELSAFVLAKNGITRLPDYQLSADFDNGYSLDFEDKVGLYKLELLAAKLISQSGHKMPRLYASCQAHENKIYQDFRSKIKRFLFF